MTFFRIPKTELPGLLLEVVLDSIIVKQPRAMKDINKVTIQPKHFVKGVVRVYIYIIVAGTCKRTRKGPKYKRVP